MRAENTREKAKMKRNIEAEEKTFGLARAWPWAKTRTAP